MNKTEKMPEVKKRYSYRMVDKYPEHVRNNCYAILDHGHTMFPSDVVRKIKSLESFCNKQAERTKELEEIRCNFVEMLRDCTLMQHESDMRMIKRKAMDFLSTQEKGETEK